MLKREDNDGTYVTDIPQERLTEFHQALSARDTDKMYGMGADAGLLTLFGTSSRYDGRRVTGYRMQPKGRVPHPFDGVKQQVDWDQTEKINRVPLQDIDPRPLTATQGMVTHAGMRHYLTDTTGELFDQRYSVSNQFPAIFEDLDSGERKILTGHHRAAAALIKGEPLAARLVRGRMLKRR